jgi:hypothetical protein
MLADGIVSMSVDSITAAQVYPSAIEKALTLLARAPGAAVHAQAVSITIPARCIVLRGVTAVAAVAVAPTAGAGADTGVLLEPVDSTLVVNRAAERIQRAARARRQCD